jgi:hypothetical protein
MPRYIYRCTECEEVHAVMHAICDTIKDCKNCSTSGTMIKQLTSATYMAPKNNKVDDKVGELTKEYIESNRELLEEEKQKARNQTYDQT